MERNDVREISHLISFPEPRVSPDRPPRLQAISTLTPIFYPTAYVEKRFYVGLNM